MVPKRGRGGRAACDELERRQSKKQGYGHLRPRGTPVTDLELPSLRLIRFLKTLETLTGSLLRASATVPERLDLVIVTLWPPGTE